jgi:hypothetical protein
MTRPCFKGSRYGLGPHPGGRPSPSDNSDGGQQHYRERSQYDYHDTKFGFAYRFGQSNALTWIKLKLAPIPAFGHQANNSAPAWVNFT